MSMQKSLFRAKLCGAIKGKHPPKGNREQHFLLWHFWVGVEATTSSATKVLQQELRGKCSLPSGLAIPAYLGRIPLCHAHEKPSFIYGLERYFAVRHIWP